MPETTQPNQETFNAIKNLLLPHMEDHNERSALVRSALYGCPVLEQIDWSGSSSVFTVHLIEKLLNFGECQQGHPAIVLLLEELKSRTGIDQHSLIDALIEVYTSHLEINQTTIKSDQEPPLISLLSRSTPPMSAPQVATMPSPAFNVYEAIDRYHAAFDARKWESARTILNEIRAEGVKIPRTFNIDSLEQDILREMQAEERENEYNVVSRLSKAKSPNATRIREALQAFWETYPDYDPDNLVGLPYTAQEYFKRGDEYREKGNYDQAIAEYTNAIRLNPQYAIAYHNRGYSYHRGKHDYDRAIADYTEAIRLDPKDALSYYNRGSTYHDKQDYDRAIADYTEAILLDPQYTGAYNARGGAYHTKGEYDRAIADYTEAILLDPQYTGAYNARGGAYHTKGEYDRAIADYETVLRIDPNNLYATKSLQYVREYLASQKK